MPYEYDRNSLGNFVNRQGGSLANLGASPTYTGAPTMRGSPQTPYQNINQNAYQNASPQAAFQIANQPGPTMEGRALPAPVNQPYATYRPGMPVQPGVRQPYGINPGLQSLGMNRQPPDRMQFIREAIMRNRLMSPPQRRNQPGRRLSMLGRNPTLQRYR